MRKADTSKRQLMITGCNYESQGHNNIRNPFLFTFINLLVQVPETGVKHFFVDSLRRQIHLL